MDRLGLTDDELLPRARRRPADDRLRASSTTGPQLPILLDLTAEAAERAGAAMLRALGARAGPDGRPLDHLLARDFAAFEDDLGDLAERGFTVRRRGGG